MRSQYELAGVNPSANLQLWTIAIVQSLQLDCGPPLLVCHRNRFAFGKATVETNREAPSDIVMEHAGHPDDTVNVRE